MEKTEILLEEALNEAPNFVKYLRERFGGKVTTDVRMNTSLKLIGTAKKDTVIILLDGKEIGKYERLYDCHRTYKQTFEGMIPVKLEEDTRYKGQKDEIIPFP